MNQLLTEGGQSGTPTSKKFVAGLKPLSADKGARRETEGCCATLARICAVLGTVEVALSIAMEGFRTRTLLCEAAFGPRVSARHDQVRRLVPAALPP